MPTLLRIDASSRLSGSLSRDLGDRFEAAWRAQGSGFRVLRRDVIAEPIAAIEQETITAFYTPPDQLTPPLRRASALSDRLIDELTHADELLITTPMYNFCVPAALKAWIDQVVRINRTFSYDGQAFTGLVPIRRATVVTAYGADGYLNGGSFAAADHCAPYMKFILNFIGVASVEHIALEGTTGDVATVTEQLQSAKRRIEHVARA